MCADGSLGVRCIWWLLQCSHLMVPLCIVVCPVGARLPGLLKTPPTDPCGQVGSSLIKGCFFPRFSAFFCGFSEENIVFVLHYDLKCIFQDI